MKAAAFVLAAVFVAGLAAPAHAQLGGLGKIKGAVDKGIDAKGKYDDMNFTEAEERQLGEQVSLKLRERFGVYQDANVTKYVTLVGTTLAKESARPTLDWKFIVLDTDGVNAYAAPGGLVHVTRGLLGLMKNEAELAGVLGHEVTHIAVKHTIRAIQKSKGISAGTDVAGAGAGARTQFITKLSGIAFDKIFEGQFSQDDELESDRVGTQVANKLGYLPSGIADVLKKIDARNSAHNDRNGWFASHPATKERIEKNGKQISSEKLTANATVEPRYKATITFDAKPITEVPVDDSGAAGLASGDKKKGDDPKAVDKKKEDEDKKKGGFGAGSIAGGGKQQAESQQASSA